MKLSASTLLKGFKGFNPEKWLEVDWLAIEKSISFAYLIYQESQGDSNLH